MCSLSWIHLFTPIFTASLVHRVFSHLSTDPLTLPQRAMYFFDTCTDGFTDNLVGTTDPFGMFTINEDVVTCPTVEVANVTGIPNSINGVFTSGPTVEPVVLASDASKSIKTFMPTLNSAFTLELMVSLDIDSGTPDPGTTTTYRLIEFGNSTSAVTDHVCGNEFGFQLSLVHYAGTGEMRFETQMLTNNVGCSNSGSSANIKTFIPAAGTMFNLAFTVTGDTVSDILCFLTL